MKDEEKIPLDSDSLLTMIYGCLVVIGCIMPLGLAWDFWMYWEKNSHQKRRGEKQPGMFIHFRILGWLSFHPTYNLFCQFT